VRREKTTVSQEDYLKAIWEIIQEEQVPIAARLAEELGVTPPAVTAALKRMTRDGYVRVGRNGRIRLTPRGRHVAEHLVLRHRLAEKLLTEVLNLPWSKAHEEAERLEHGISNEVERLLLARFGKDSSCPHGVPLFGGMARLRRREQAVRLAEMEKGDRIEVLRVWEKDPRFLDFVAGMDLRPRARARVVGRAYDETITLEVNGRRVHLGKPATSRIWVRRLSS
jgi:DtxR family Mn-dependent transcriptional regulator